MMRPSLLALTVTIPAFLAGCGASGPPMSVVTGKITAEGKPVAGAAVMFLPAVGGRPAAGETDAAGVYRLQTFKDFDGAILGEHRVAVTMPEAGGSQGTKTASGTISGSSSAPAPPSKTGFEKYAKPDESGLTAQVTREPKTYDFDLKPAK